MKELDAHEGDRHGARSRSFVYPRALDEWSTPRGILLRAGLAYGAAALFAIEWAPVVRRFLGPLVRQGYVLALGEKGVDALLADPTFFALSVATYFLVAWYAFAVFTLHVAVHREPGVFATGAVAVWLLYLAASAAVTGFTKGPMVAPEPLGGLPLATVVFASPILAIMLHDAFWVWSRSRIEAGGFAAMFILAAYGLFHAAAQSELARLLIVSLTVAVLAVPWAQLILPWLRNQEESG